MSASFLDGDVFAIPISVSTSGQTALVAADGAGRRIIVLDYVIVCTGAVVVKFQSNSTDLTGPMSFGANGGVGSANSPYGRLWTNGGEALNINLGGAVQVSGHLVYRLR